MTDAVAPNEDRGAEAAGAGAGPERTLPALKAPPEPDELFAEIGRHSREDPHAALARYGGQSDDCRGPRACPAAPDGSAPSGAGPGRRVVTGAW